MQNTGNPVLDSTVNAFAATAAIGCTHAETVQLLKEIHAAVLELAEKEPGGLCPPSWKGEVAR